MILHRSRRAALVAPLSSVAVTLLAATLLAATLIALPAASASAQPELASGQPAPAPAPPLGTVAPSGTVTFRAIDSAEPGTDSFTGPPSTIFCAFDTPTPHVADLSPFEIQGTALAACTWQMPKMAVEVSLFRNGSEVSSSVAVAFNKQFFGLDTFAPCVGGAYFTAGTATIFPPPGYTPSFRVFTDVSVPVAINAAGTAVPPFICQQSSGPGPDPDPPPVINSLSCQVPNRIDISCSLSASNWTQIRWTVDGQPVTAWNNRTSVQGNCMEIISSDPIPLIEIKDVAVRVAVSNAAGTTNRQVNVQCLATG